MNCKVLAPQLRSLTETVKTKLCWP